MTPHPQGMVLATRCHAWVISRPPPRVCSKEGGEAVPRTRGPWPGGPKAHGPEGRKPSPPHGRRQHRPSAGYPFSLIRDNRDPSLNHEIDVELP